MGLHAGDAAAAPASILPLSEHPLLRTVQRLSAVSPTQETPANLAAPFYLLLALCLALGAVRIGYSRQLRAVSRAFVNPELSTRQLRDGVGVAAVTNALLNALFVLSSAAFLQALLRLYNPLPQIPAVAQFVLLAAAIAAVYGVKWVVARASAWAFGIRAASEQYLFNVFLINKAIGVTLIPMTVLLTFAGKAFAPAVVVVSCLVVGLLLLLRYIRAWPALTGVFNASRLHFFLYLCASEILPLAVLVKWLTHWGAGG